ncbi:MAG: DUF998 domain-containing protein [Acidimicrobiia bacterium]|nr:DUF998 domain-containing protein [Acidimicrobiia bacterium]
MSAGIADQDSVADETRTSPGPAPRRAALGITALLVAALVAFAFAPMLLPESYSWVEHGISESAAQGIDGAWLARGGLILYGLAVVWLVGIRHSTWGPLATALFAVFGASMFGVAAFAAKPWEEDAVFVESEDMLHSAFAGSAGFAFVAGILTLIVARRHRSVRAAIPDWVAFLVAAIVPLTASASIWGALQRLMFFTAAVWYAREAWRAKPVH